MTIEWLLHRRPDLSTFLVHFTRDGEDAEARDRLISILSDRRLEARTELGMARGRGVEDPDQRVVCFTETPLEHVWMMLEDIEGREVTLGAYGVVFTKVWGRRHGVNPVWYLDTTPGHDWLTNPINEMIEDALTEDAAGTIFHLTPYIEQMGTWDHGRKEFWWEREWRKGGDLEFEWTDLVAVFAPEDDHDQLAHDLDLEAEGDPLIRFLDPGWGLERMIGALAGIPDADAGPLPH